MKKKATIRLIKCYDIEHDVETGRLDVMFIKGKTHQLSIDIKLMPTRLFTIPKVGYSGEVTLSDLIFSLECLANQLRIKSRYRYKRKRK